MRYFPTYLLTSWEYCEDIWEEAYWRSFVPDLMWCWSRKPAHVQIPILELEQLREDADGRGQLAEAADAGAL